jgi:hypothetical protein
VRFRLVLLGVAVMSLAACGADDTATPASQPLPGVSAPATDTPDILQFTAPLIGGGTFDASTVAGTPTVFWFWAPG